MMINLSNETQLMVTFNNQAEQLLLITGYEKMSIDDKNSLLAIIAKNENIAFTDITNDYILNHHKNLKIKSLEQACLDSISAGFTSTNGHTYRTNPDDQTNMIGKRIELLDDATIQTVTWRAEDLNDWISHSASDWLTYVYKQAFSNKENQLQKYNNLRGNVLQATTSDAINAIVWS